MEDMDSEESETTVADRLLKLTEALSLTTKTEFADEAAALVFAAEDVDAPSSIIMEPVTMTSLLRVIGSK